MVKNKEKIMDIEDIKILNKSGYKLDLKEFESILKKINDDGCVHPFLYHNSEYEDAIEDHLLYLCLECLKHVELTPNEALLRHTISNFDEEFVISAYKKHRETFGINVDYYDLDKILEKVLDEANIEIRENGKSK